MVKFPVSEETFEIFPQKLNTRRLLPDFLFLFNSTQECRVGPTTDLRAAEL
jgi:hypothetical protein